jgi:hypothetical protein
MNIKLKLFFYSILILASSLTFSEEPLTDSLEAIGFSESLVTTQITHSLGASNSDDELGNQSNNLRKTLSTDSWDDERYYSDIFSPRNCSDIPEKIPFDIAARYFDLVVNGYGGDDDIYYDDYFNDSSSHLLYGDQGDDLVTTIVRGGMSLAFGGSGTDTIVLGHYFDSDIGERYYYSIEDITTVEVFGFDEGGFCNSYWIFKIVAAEHTFYLNGFEQIGLKDDEALENTGFRQVFTEQDVPLNTGYWEFSGIGMIDLYELFTTDYDDDGIIDFRDDDDDSDGVDDDDDAFPLNANESLDTDGDGTGNNEDTDDDNDGVLDADDAFPLDPLEVVDADADGIGDSADNCPNASNSDQLNSDDDGLGNVCDTDDDNDTVLDVDDAFPLDATETLDTDSDGVGDNSDAFPNDASETLDSDSDGVGDNSDAFPNNALYKADTDSDGMPDEWETRYGLDPNDPSDATSDQDNDGVTALDEFLAGTIPSGSLDLDGDGQYDALTDGLLLLRGMFGLDGSALVAETIASDAVYRESVDIEARIATLGDLADIDGNGDIDALTDGLLTLRYLFGLRGDTLINGVVADDATRKTAEEIEAHLETLMPAL